MFWLKFSVTIDPTAKRLPGAGDEDSSIVVSPVCQQNVIDGVPADPAGAVPCGDWISEPITVGAPGKDD